MRMRNALAAVCSFAVLFFLTAHSTAAREKKIVLIAGKKSHGPGEHEYLKSVRLLKVLLDRAPNLKGIKTEIYYNGWPDDPKVLDSADTIVMISDGMEWLPWGMSEDRVAIMQKEMDRGCGYVTLHFTTYVPAKYGKQALEWNGAFVDYDGDLKFRSTLKTTETDVVLVDRKHPVLRGVKPYHYKDEFYYKLHFADPPAKVEPLVRVTSLDSTPSGQTVAWALERKNGSRSVGMTYGHYFENWRLDDYRKLILNAIVWSAKIKVPKSGVTSNYIEDAEVDKAIGSPAP